jgi:hypothetical protein
MRRLTAVVVGIGLVGFGVAIGHVATVASYGVLADSVQASSFELLQQEAYARYRCGQPERAEGPLLRQAELAQSLAANASDAGQKETFRHAAALAYGRMAVLRERAGRPVESAELFRKAVAALQAADSTTADDIRKAVLTFDASWEHEFRSGS